MKKNISILIIVCFIGMLSGCGNPKTIGGKFYLTVGFFTDKDPSIQYEVSIGNVIWTILLSESIVFPIYFLGFSLWNPICKK